MRDKLIPILERVLKCELPKSLDENAQLESYGMDSLNCIALIVELETCFNIVIDDTNLAISSVDSICKIQILIENSSKKEALV